MDYSEILRSNKLSLTAQRIEILYILSSSDRAVSEKDLELLMKGNCNRTTVYRTLNSLVDKGIVHRILSSEAIKYRLAERNDGRIIKADHIHFECKKCNTTFCLEEIPVVDYALPEGFTRQENQFIIIGICKNCSNDLVRDK